MEQNGTERGSLCRVVAEDLGEAAASRARGSNPSEADWNVNVGEFTLVLEDGLIFSKDCRIHTVDGNLKKYSCSPCQQVSSVSVAFFQAPCYQ